jgi:hypothetical protein
MVNNYLKSYACSSFARKDDWPIEARALISCYMLVISARNLQQPKGRLNEHGI